MASPSQHTRSSLPPRLQRMAARNTSTAGLAQPTFDFGDVPATPPAHIWALKALRNQFLGTRPSPLVTPSSPEDDIDEISLAPQPSPSSPSKGGILKTPGTITRRKSVTFNNKERQGEATSTSDAIPQQHSQQKDAPQGKRTPILARNFPGKYPSPYTPRTRTDLPRQASSQHHRAPVVDNDETDVIAISRSAAEALASHAQLLSETNTRLQEYISSGELTYKTYSPYAAHPDLETMHRELEREKQVLKGLFEDFEHQQAEMARREQQLDKQYCQLKLQMEESHAFQSSTEQMMEDCSRRIQELNQVIRTNESRHQKEMNEMEHKVESHEERWRSVQGELDEAKDQLRGQAQEIEGKNVLIYDGQEKIKRLQKQLAQLKMETLEARVAPASQTGVKEGSGEAGNRGWGHRRTTSRRTVSATYPTTTLSHHGPVDPISSTMDPTQQPKSSDEVDTKPARFLSPRNLNVEEPVVQQANAPGQDVLARRAAAAKRLQDRQRNRDRIGKENSWLN